ncbi:MAG: hypothetical protein U0Q15_11045 [Kineosporiaceae bacterium]
MTDTTLSTILADPARRTQAVAALTAAVEAEVQGRSGLSSLPIKAGYKAVTAVKPTIVATAIDRMLPDFASSLDPFWATRGAQPFGAHLAAQGDSAAEALLSVTDSRAVKPDHAGAAKIYNGLRPKAKELVEAALPRVGDAFESVTR